MWVANRVSTMTTTPDYIKSNYNYKINELLRLKGCYNIPCDGVPMSQEVLAYSLPLSKISRETRYGVNLQQCKNSSDTKEWYEKKITDSGILNLHIEIRKILSMKIIFPKRGKEEEKTIVPYQQMSEEFIQEVKERTAVLGVKEGNFVSCMWESHVNVSASKAFKRENRTQFKDRIAEIGLTAIQEEHSALEKTRLTQSTSTVKMEDQGGHNFNLEGSRVGINQQNNNHNINNSLTYKAELHKNDRITKSEIPQVNSVLNELEHPVFVKIERSERSRSDKYSAREESIYSGYTRKASGVVSMIKTTSQEQSNDEEKRKETPYEDNFTQLRNSIRNLAEIHYPQVEAVRIIKPDDLDDEDIVEFMC